MRQAVEVAQVHGEGSPEYQRLSRQFHKAEQAEEDATQAYFRMVLAPLTLAHAAPIRLRRGITNPRLRKNAETARRWLERKLGSQVLQCGDHFVMRVEGHPNSTLERDEYNRATRQLTMRESASVSNILHEFGHQLEHNPRVHQIARDFVDLRCGNDAWTHLATAFPNKGFDSNEWGRKDDFDRVFSSPEAYYVGKWYPDHTELLSMGLQLLYDNPIRFAEHDPDYFQVLTGILSGRLL